MKEEVKHIELNTLGNSLKGICVTCKDPLHRSMLKVGREVIKTQMFKQEQGGGADRRVREISDNAEKAIRICFTQSKESVPATSLLY